MKEKWCVLLLVLAGCPSGGGSAPVGAGDDVAGGGDVVDAGVREAVVDAGDNDVVVADAGDNDVVVADAGDVVADAGDNDVVVADAGDSDVVVADAGDVVVDAGDDGVADAGDNDVVVVDAGVVDAGDELPDCPVFAEGVAEGFLLNLAVREASGVVEGRRNPGVLWTHEDSGGEPRLFAMTTTGRPRGSYVLAGAEAIDWEDIAAGPGLHPDVPALYLGDVGDNGTSRASIQVYRVDEPVVGDGSLLPVTLDGVERFELVYPDGPHNAETLLVDPTTGDLFVVVKSSDGDSPVFAARAPLQAGTTTVLERVARLRFGVDPLPGDPTTTAGDITAAGDLIAIRTYDHAFLWRRLPGRSIAEALSTPACPLPLREESQGEALGFALDGDGYYSVSEGSAVRLFFYARQ